MIKLEKILKDKHSYINSWNIFSKSIIIKNNIENLKSILIISESEKDIEQYQKILSFLKINSNNITDENDLINLIHNENWVFLIDVSKLNIKVVDKTITKDMLYLEIKKDYNLDSLIDNLNKFWYNFSEYWIKWSYKKSWDTLNIVSFNWNYQYIISFWWDNIEEIKKIDIISDYIKVDSNLSSLYLWSNKIIDNNWHKEIIEYINEKKIFKILDSIDFNQNYDSLTNKLDNFCCFDYIWNKTLKINDLWINDINIESIIDFKEILKDKSNKNYIFTRNRQVVDNFLNYNDIKNIHINETKLNNIKSFKTDNRHNIICDDIVSKIFIRKRLKKNLSWEIDLLLKIKNWDYVVHIDHGIWIFVWTIKKELNWIVKEYIEIDYLKNDKLFVPITEVWRVNKYLWVENPKLTSLNTKEWENKIKKANVDAQKIAEELLEIYSKRKIWKSDKFIDFKDLQDKFKNSFKYTYTIDQESTIDEISRDLSLEEPMDRLIVWDVWFGKTEIAFNAIYKTFLNKKQSVFISPLVVLTYEHYEKAIERFRWFWLKIAVLTRLETAKKTNEVLLKLEKWELDLVIWTHKLLSDKIKYKWLWLLIVDEEHKFWVKDKEKIKKLKSSINVLSMSATPIPRSLNMAMSSLRSISIIKTAPFWRQSIDTTISKYSENVIYEACKKEFDRWWQVFFIHNRVLNIEIFKKSLLNMFPEKKVVVTHWRLEWTQLEKRIIDFKNKKYDILLSTTVIENGIDFSNVNTIIINDAPNFWISQIHQLRWRVWRSDKKWYCYLLYKNELLEADTIKRLKTIVDYSYLWAWFELAMKDLEIRWWWDILGIRQSGQTTEIWINLFLKMIEDKIEQLKSNINQTSNTEEKKEKNQEIKLNTKIDLNINIWIPDNYFSWELDKINYYREIESISSLNDLNNIINDFNLVYCSDNNKIPKETSNLFDILKLKIYSKSYYIKSIKKVWLYYQIDFIESLNLDKLKEFLILDKEVIFSVINVSKLKAKTNKFKKDDDFLTYMISLFEDNLKVKSKFKKIQ